MAKRTKSPDRLSAALKASKPKRAKKSAQPNGRWTSATASAASKAYWASHPVEETKPTRLRKVAVDAAARAWPESAERISQMSDAVLHAAETHLRNRFS